MDTVIAPIPARAEESNACPIARRSFRDVLSHAIECVLAIVLLAASALKLYELATTSHPIAGITQNRLLLTAAIHAEWLLAIWLLVGGFPRLRRTVTLCCFGAFTSIALYERTHHMASCGCFGILEVPPLATAIFDACAVLGLLWTWPESEVASRRWSMTRIILTSVAAIVATVLPWSVYAAHADVNAAQSLAEEGGTIEVDPDAWTGKPFPLFEHFASPGGKSNPLLAEPLRQGQWLIVLYHHDCHICQQTVPVYLQMAHDLYVRESAHGGVVHHVAFVEIPPFGSPDEALLEPSKEIATLALQSDREWFVATPIVVALKDGQVMWHYEGARAADPPPPGVW